MELEDAIHTALLTLKEGFEGQIAADNIEVHSRCALCQNTPLIPDPVACRTQVCVRRMQVGIIGEDNKFRVLSPSEVADYLEEVE